VKFNIFSDSLYSAFSGILLLSGNFLSGVIVAHLLGVTDTGEFYFFIALCLLAATILDGGAASSVVRFHASLSGQNNVRAAHALAGRLARHLLAYVAAGLSLMLMSANFGTLSAALDLPPIGDALPGHPDLPFFLLLGLSVLVQTMALFAIAYLRGSRRFRLLAGLSLASMTAQLGLVWFCAITIGVTGAIIGYGLGQIPLAVVTIGLLFRRGSLDRSVRTEVRRYQRFAWAANVCNIFVWSRIEVFLLQYFWGPREVGLFSVALALSALASQGPMLMTGAFLPLLSERHGRGDTDGVQRAFSGGTRLLAMIAFPACMGMVAILPAVVGLLYGPQFAPSVPASMIVCAAAAISVTAVIGTHAVSALARSDFIFYTSLFGAFLSILLGLSIIPAFGVAGAAMSRSITQLVMIGAGIWFVTARLHFTYPFAALFRILLATMPATIAAYIVVDVIESLAGIIAAICLFIPVYLAGVRAFSALPASDAELLHAFSSRLPRMPAQALHHLLLAIGSARTTQRSINPAE
jgi:O-antigen/teichoic acid export membrane protein